MMSLSRKGISNNDPKLNSPSKKTTLNPNAAEFIPCALRTSSGTTSISGVTSGLVGSGTSGKAALDRSESNVSNNSDDEAHRYWRHQLPDDITPDFKFMGADDLQGPRSLSLAGLSLDDAGDASRFSASMGNGRILSKQQDLSSHGIDSDVMIEKMRFAIPSYRENRSSAAFMNLPTDIWHKQFMNGDQHVSSEGEGFPYNGNSGPGFVNDMLGEQLVLDDTNINPVEYLASQFPGFAAESLAEVYCANGYDLNLTIEMLTQLEFQVDNDLNQNLSSKTLLSQNLSVLDFPALSATDGQNGPLKYSGGGIQQTSNPLQSSGEDGILFFKSNYSSPSRGAIDFTSAVRKLASQESGQWKYEGNGSTDASAGSSKSSILSSSYSGGHGRSIYGAKMQNHGTVQTSPIWLENGEAVENMYSELRGEARDHARLHNACFEQARQAHLIGNKALVKGQLHNMHMKAAHGKAQESSIYHQRNPIAPELQGYGRGQEQLIDLHGLNVNEAIRMLKHELNILRTLAKSSQQRLQVYISVGTGHHTKGSRTPAKLPVAVEQYLLEEERLDCTQPQPGLLRVVIY